MREPGASSVGNRPCAPVIARDLLSVDPTLEGLLGSAEGLGTLLGALTIAVRRDIHHHGRLFVAGALIVSLAVMVVGWSPWFALPLLVLPVIFLTPLVWRPLVTISEEAAQAEEPAGLKD